MTHLFDSSEWKPNTGLKHDVCCLGNGDPFCSGGLTFGPLCGSGDIRMTSHLRGVDCPDCLVRFDALLAVGRAFVDQAGTAGAFRSGVIPGWRRDG